MFGKKTNALTKFKIAFISLGFISAWFLYRQYFNPQAQGNSSKSRYQLPAGIQPNPDQVAALKNIQQSSEETFAAIRSQIASLEGKIKEAQKSGSPMIPMLIQQLGSLQKELKNTDFRAQQQIVDLLTPEQRSQLEDFSPK